MIPGADERVLVYFDGQIGCVYCPCDGSDCFACGGSGVMDTLETVDACDVEPVKFLEDACE